MTTTIDYCKCPKCGNKFEMGFKNYWLSSLFGEYSSNETRHTCENCSSTFSVSAKKQVKFITKLIK